MQRITKILLVIVLVIFSLYIYFFTTWIVKNPSGNTVRDAMHYRLGDVVLHEGFNKKWINRTIYHYMYHGTIAHEYMLRTKDSKQFPDYDVLHQIIKEKSKDHQTPKDNELIIHLRLGDIIDWEYQEDIEELLEGKKYWQFIRDYKYFEEKLEKLDNKVNKIILVGGFHTDGDHSRSYLYLEKIITYLEKKKFSVETRIDKASADEDFIYMSNSKNFLKSCGGYSRIVNEMVDRNNGIILNKDIDY